MFDYICYSFSGLAGSALRCRLLGQVCWVRFAGTGLLGQAFWERFAGLGLLGQVCWLRFAKCGLLG